MPFTQQQIATLSPERQAIVRDVAEYLGGNLDEHCRSGDPEDFESAFELIAPCDGCVPDGDADDNLWQAIRKKFACVFWPVAKLMAQRIGYDESELTLVIDPDHEDASRVLIVQERLRLVLLHYAAKPWRFHFDSLAAVVEFIERQVNEATSDHRELTSGSRPNGETCPSSRSCLVGR